ncbi:hypothetical protein HOY82DRAFT_597389 [Tuber indicum]|nr:hypothetical protein HOY82DRAFT_597389 [Tuber indicum]
MALDCPSSLDQPSGNRFDILYGLDKQYNPARYLLLIDNPDRHYRKHICAACIDVNFTSQASSATRIELARATLMESLGLELEHQELVNTTSEVTARDRATTNASYSLIDNTGLYLGGNCNTLT